jgi:hypothetical protein
MKYSKDLIEEIVRYIESGATNEDACIMAGVSESEFYLWLSDAPKNPLSEEQKSELSEAMGKAKARRKTVLANRIIKATEDEYLKDVEGNIVRDKDGKPIMVARGDWRAAAFYLERTAPETYAKKEELKHSGEMTNKVLLDNIPEEVINDIRKAYRESIRNRKPTDSPETNE